jgi:hypothetical protein
VGEFQCYVSSEQGATQQTSGMMRVARETEGRSGCRGFRLPGQRGMREPDNGPSAAKPALAHHVTPNIAHDAKVGLVTKGGTKEEGSEG